MAALRSRLNLAILAFGGVFSATAVPARSQAGYTATSTLSTATTITQITGTNGGLYTNTGNFAKGGTTGGTDGAPTITAANGGAFITLTSYDPDENHGLALGSVKITFQGGTTATSSKPTTGTSAEIWKITGGTHFVTYSITDSIDLQLFGAGETSTSDVLLSSTSSGTSALGATGGSGTVTADQTAANWSTYSTTAGGITLTSTADNLAQYESSSGTFTMDISALIHDTINNGFGGDDESLFESGATVTITAISFVAEPGTWALLLSFAAAAAFCLRRRRLRSQLTDYS